MVTALLGGVAGGGVVALTGDDPSPAPTVLQPRRERHGDTSSAALNSSAVFASVSPGVVEIAASGVRSEKSGPFGQGSAPSTATGTGFVVDGQGHIVTAAHVVDGASSVKVTFQDGTTRTAKVLGKDDATDVAVLKVDPSGLTLHPLKLGSSASLGVGDAVAAIGDPFGYDEQPQHRHRLRARPHDPGAQRLHRRPRDPDRRGDEPGQLRRPDPRRRRPA